MRLLCGYLRRFTIYGLNFWYNTPLKLQYNCVYTVAPSKMVMSLALRHSSTPQGGEDSKDPQSCRLFSTKEPLNIGHFCGKWPIKIKDPMTLHHPVLLSGKTRDCPSMPNGALFSPRIKIQLCLKSCTRQDGRAAGNFGTALHYCSLFPSSLLSHLCTTALSSLALLLSLPLHCVLSLILLGKKEQSQLCTTALSSLVERETVCFVLNAYWYVTYQWHIWMSHVTYQYHIWMSHIAYQSHIRMSRVACQYVWQVASKLALPLLNEKYRHHNHNVCVAETQGSLAKEP